MGGLLPLGGRTTPGVGANVLFVPRGSASSFWAVTIVMIDRRDRTFIFVCFIVIVICNGLGSGRRGRISVSFSIVDKKVIEMDLLCGWPWLVKICVCFVCCMPASFKFRRAPYFIVGIFYFSSVCCVLKSVNTFQTILNEDINKFEFNNGHILI